MESLKPCPFCGGEAEFEREGTSRQSCIVSCTECGCRLESNETHDSGDSWNTRTCDDGETTVIPKVNPSCSCYECNPDPTFRSITFIVCEKCGNKRCPRATNHIYHCTGSNEPGQEGSNY